MSGCRPREHLFELLAQERRVLVIARRASGKTALGTLLTSQAASRDLGFGFAVPLLVAVDRLGTRRLDEAELGRQNPLLGAAGVARVLEAGDGLIIVDGFDGAASIDARKASIADLGRRYPAARIVVFTRPLPRKVPGRSETAIEGFLTVRTAAPVAPDVATIHELQDHRSEAHRVKRIGEVVHGLLECWSFGALPRASVLARLTSRGLLFLASRLAAGDHGNRTVELVEIDLLNKIELELQGARWFAETEMLLHEDEHPQGGAPLEDPAALAKAIVQEIRMHPGVLVERRSGVFAFADLAVQQYLAAIFFAAGCDTAHFVEVRDDPWWHEVIVFAAGLPAPWSSSLPAKTLVRALLDASASADSATTFLAARCASVASFLPSSLRAEIDRRLRATILPRSDAQVAHLVDDIGEVAAPALVAALPSVGANERAFIATALGQLVYAPSVRVLAGLVDDEKATTEPITLRAGPVDAVVEQAPVGLFAFAAFFHLALVNSVAYRMFDDVVARVSRGVRETFVRLVASKIVGEKSWGEETEDESEADADRVEELVEKVVRASGVR